MMDELIEMKYMAKEKANDDLLWTANYLNHAGSRYHSCDWGSSDGHVVCVSDEESD